MLPDGKAIATMQAPLAELLVFIGERDVCVNVSGFGGRGFILIRKGQKIAGYFTDDYHRLVGKDAFDFLYEKPILEFEICEYIPEEMNSAISECGDEGWLVTDSAEIPSEPVTRPLINPLERDVINMPISVPLIVTDSPEPTRDTTSPIPPSEMPLPDSATKKPPSSTDEEKLANISRQPGVIGVSAFFEGFPVLSYGAGDFEQVSAIAEDLLRAGISIASDLGIGNLDQLILETVMGKFIIAPFEDLFICVQTKPEANLGLIRLAIKAAR